MAVLIKNVSEEKWRAFKAEAARRGLNVGDLFNDMVDELLTERRQDDQTWDRILEGKRRISEEDAEAMLKDIQRFREGFRFDDSSF